MLTEHKKAELRWVSDHGRSQANRKLTGRNMVCVGSSPARSTSDEAVRWASVWACKLRPVRRMQPVRGTYLAQELNRSFVLPFTITLFRAKIRNLFRNCKQHCILRFHVLTNALRVLRCIILLPGEIFSPNANRCL
jgi:hypothetical protein